MVYVTDGDYEDFGELDMKLQIELIHTLLKDIGKRLYSIEKLLALEHTGGFVG